MKAWLVREKGEFCATVVFAETRGKAKAVALYTECCENANFCNVEVHRQPQIDKCYTDGKKQMDWDSSQDRIALVRDCGFYCSDETFFEEECESCSARKYCDKYRFTEE